MNTRKEHDDKLIELVTVWEKLSRWNRFVVWLYAFGKLVQQKLKSIVQ